MTKDKISLLRRFWALWHLRAACFAQGQKQEIGRFKSRAALLTKQNEDLLARVCRPQSMEPKLLGQDLAIGIQGLGIRGPGSWVGLSSRFWSVEILWSRVCPCIASV